VFQISCRNRFRVFANAVNSGMRQRWHQAMSPASSVSRGCPFALKTSRELFFHQVGPVEMLVVGGDLRQRLPLSAGEAAGVLAQCPHRGTKRGGLVTLAGRAQFTGQAAARALQGLPGPLDDVEPEFYHWSGIRSVIAP
jgi:hypothetical protein